MKSISSESLKFRTVMASNSAAEELFHMGQLPTMKAHQIAQTLRPASLHRRQTLPTYLGPWPLKPSSADLKGSTVPSTHSNGERDSLADMLASLDQDLKRNEQALTLEKAFALNGGESVTTTVVLLEDKDGNKPGSAGLPCKCELQSTFMRLNVFYVISLTALFGIIILGPFVIFSLGDQFESSVYKVILVAAFGIWYSSAIIPLLLMRKRLKKWACTYAAKQDGAEES